MPRLALALLFMLPAVSAAPVPKALKGKAPLVSGTKWVGEQEAEDISPVELTFHADGKMTWHYPKRKQTYHDGFRQQDGVTLTYDVNKRYAWTTLTYKDGVFEGTATNVKGVTWKVKLTPVETK
jgi:hypothetical protein